MHIIDEDITEILERTRAREIREFLREKMRRPKTISDHTYCDFLRDRLVELPYSYLEEIQRHFTDNYLPLEALKKMKDDLINKRVRPPPFQTNSIEGRVQQYVAQPGFSPVRLVDYFLQRANATFKKWGVQEQLSLTQLLNINDQEALMVYCEGFSVPQLDRMNTALEATDPDFQDGSDFFYALKQGASEANHTRCHSNPIMRARKQLDEYGIRADKLCETIRLSVQSYYTRSLRPPPLAQNTAPGFSQRVSRNKNQPSGNP